MAIQSAIVHIPPIIIKPKSGIIALQHYTHIHIDEVEEKSLILWILPLFCNEYVGRRLNLTRYCHYPSIFPLRARKRTAYI